MSFDRINRGIQVALHSLQIARREAVGRLVDALLKPTEVFPTEPLGIVTHMENHPAPVCRIRFAAQMTHGLQPINKGSDGRSAHSKLGG